MSVTIKDIAKKANVSIMTVSRVVNNSGRVSKETREIVQNAINEMNYKPNLMARSLIKNKSKFISVIVPDIANPFFSELIKGMERIARLNGYSIILSDTNWTEDLEVDHIEGAMRRMADGIVIVAPIISEKKLELYNQDVPIVVVDRTSKYNNISHVFVDNVKGASIATNHLIELGHSKIAFIAGPEGIMNSELRKQGFIEVLRENGLKINPSLMFNGDFKLEGGQQAFDQINKMKLKDRPTAVFASNDQMALGLIYRAIEAGWSIPEDLSIVGYDDILVSSMVNPSLTTISHPYIQMGELALEKLLFILDGKPIEPIKNNTEYLSNQLIVRNSTATLK